MLPAITLPSVIDALQSSFFCRRLRIDNHQQPTSQWMRPTDVSDFYETAPLSNKVKLVGILFMHPDSEIAKISIIPRFGFYHQRAGEFTDFYFGGYSTHFPVTGYADQRAVIELDGTKWLFSDRAFNKFRDQLMSETKWKYSGETDLILATAHYVPERGKADIDFSQCITCCLEQLIRDSAITSVPNFFERIFDFSETQKNATAYNFSDLHLIRTSELSLLEWVLSRLGLKDYYNKSKGMAIYNISKSA